MRGARVKVHNAGRWHTHRSSVLQQHTLSLTIDEHPSMQTYRSQSISTKGMQKLKHHKKREHGQNLVYRLLWGFFKKKKKTHRGLWRNVSFLISNVFIFRKPHWEPLRSNVKSNVSLKASYNQLIVLFCFLRCMKGNPSKANIVSAAPFSHLTHGRGTYVLCISSST